MINLPLSSAQYRGRLAPSPTGFLHLGHARTFWTAQQRAERVGGVLVLRNEDLDAKRAGPEFAAAMLEDLRWFGFRWQEGPDCGGPFGPYVQSQRQDFYKAAFAKLRAGDWIYPCHCSRQDVLRSLQAPHAGEEEPIYPGTCRPEPGAKLDPLESPPGIFAKDNSRKPAISASLAPPAGRGLGRGVRPSDSEIAFGNRSGNWRFRVPDGMKISFDDGFFGHQEFQAGKDFGDFVVWRHDDVPSYQLAAVADDAAMKITEVVRGADLLVSTARQLLLYRALELPSPAFYHCPLVTDESGARLAKRHEALSLRTLRANGTTPQMVRQSWNLP
jgi:glutamyl/glutaminyl-tRNA synthetase